MDRSHFLIVVDMQKDFIDGSLGTKEAEAIVSQVIDKIDRFPGQIIATMDTHPDDYLDTAEGIKLPVPHCIKGTDGWQLDIGVKAALEKKRCTILEKPTFGSVLLPEVIRNMAGQDPLDITLIGLCTDICVVSNALLLKAHFPEAEISVDPSCCAGVSPATHTAAIETMKCCQINIL